MTRGARLPSPTGWAAGKAITLAAGILLAELGEAELGEGGEGEAEGAPGTAASALPPSRDLCMPAKLCKPARCREQQLRRRVERFRRRRRGEGVSERVGGRWRSREIELQALELVTFGTHGRLIGNTAQLGGYSGLLEALEEARVRAKPLDRTDEQRLQRERSRLLRLMAEACKARLLREHAVRLERHVLVVAGKLGMVEQKRLERDERAHRTLETPCQLIALALSGLCVAADAREPAHSRQLLQERLVRLQQRLAVAK
eukprot:jgi/Chrpa1/12129/Chrysochromulina_OHIO_Genome00017094-RA